MSTKQRFRNNKYRLELRERDHLPPHVHLTGGGLDILINLETLTHTGTCERTLLDEVLAWVQSNQQALLKEWKKWHP